jgi:hypothetical protein
MPMNDTIVTRVNKDTTNKILINDDVTCCPSSKEIKVTIITNGTKGDATFTAGGTAIDDYSRTIEPANKDNLVLTYMPNTNTFGIDSVTYEIECEVTRDGKTKTLKSQAKVYIYIYKPLAMQYFECVGRDIVVGVDYMPPPPTTNPTLAFT